jgi:hypothetical protein
MTTYADSTKKSTAVVADYSHAGRTFTANNLELSPKTKFLYHVVFKMNPFVLQGRDAAKQNLSVLVKSAELPKISVQTDTLNQYNRKKHTQIKVDYLPVVLRFHDDSNHQISELWRKYFTYYYADSISAKQPILTYVRNAMSNESINSVLGGAARFGYDNGSYAKFFNSIEIYQMSRGNWYSYELINPIISQWTHDSLDSSSSAPAEQSMTVMYEAINYDSGSGNPRKFGNADSYDVAKSPLLTNPAARQSNQPGNNDAIQRATVEGQSTVGTAINTDQNTAYANNNASIATRTVPTITSTIANSAVATAATENVSGIKNINFPSNEATQEIKASQVTL